MAYFNHAFNKTFIGTTTAEGVTPGYTTDVSKTTDLKKGQFSFFDPKSWDFVDIADTKCCPVVLVAGTIHEDSHGVKKDKIGPYHGGYAETVKSKTINPKYISRF